MSNGRPRLATIFVKSYFPRAGESVGVPQLGFHDSRVRGVSPPGELRGHHTILRRSPGMQRLGHSPEILPQPGGQRSGNAQAMQTFFPGQLEKLGRGGRGPHRPRMAVGCHPFSKRWGFIPAPSLVSISSPMIKASSSSFPEALVSSPAARAAGRTGTVGWPRIFRLMSS